MKICCICKVEKPISEFNKNKSKKDGLSTDCRECTKTYLEEYRLKNKDKLLAQSRSFKDKNREAINAKNRERYHTYKKLDPDFMHKQRLSGSRYKANNKGKVNAATAKRYTNKLKRSCITTKEDFIIIKEIYEKAAKLTESTGIKYHVDHIIPLNGLLVSGLHLPSNLQILTEQENCSKHNKFSV